MTSNSTVSAVIPVFNGEAFIAQAIHSALNQTQPPIECVVVDDGSTDGTAGAVSSFGEAVTYLRHERRGVSVTRNRGAAHARGELVAFLDHDDVWLPTKLERQVEVLTSESADMALCAMKVVDASGGVLRTKRLQPRYDLLTGMLLFDGTETVSCSSTGLMRRSTLLASGGFDPALSLSADWDLLFRMLLHGRVAYVDEPLILYRVHEANMSRDVAVMERDMRMAFSKAFSDPQLPDELRRHKRRAYSRLYRMLAGSYRDRSQTGALIRTLAAAVGLDPSIVVELVTARDRQISAHPLGSVGSPRRRPPSDS